MVVAVDRRGRAVDEGIDVQLLGHRQHRLGTADVGLFVGPRCFDRWAHPRFRSKVDDGVHVPDVQRVPDRVGVADVGLDQGKGMGGTVLDPFLFHGAGVEGIKVVDGRDAVIVVQKAAAQVTADEASPAGDADVHGRR